MRRIIIFGNSGSGKSTLAKHFNSKENLAHLDLDTLAWQPTSPPTRMPINESEVAIRDFIEQNESWVIEGCYSDLIELVLDDANEMIFLNLPVEVCINNAKSRPWESHKYESKAAQDANLPMLIDWIAQYTERTDTFSQKAHGALYTQFSGKKSMYTTQNR